MKKIANLLINKLKDLGYTPNITGKQLKQLFNISDEEMSTIQSNHLWFDEYTLETSTKYFNELGKKFDFYDEVLWFEHKDDSYPEYVSVGSEKLYDDCEVFLAMFNLISDNENDFYHNLVPTIKCLLKYVENEEMHVYGQYYDYTFYDIKLHDHKIISVEFLKDDFNEKHYRILLAQLIAMSYDTPIIETLSVLGLYK